MDVDILRRICGDGRHHFAQPISRVQYCQHDYFQYIVVSGIFITSANNVFGSGRGAQGKCDQRYDPTVGVERGPGVFQVSEVLQHQAGTSPSLFGVPEMCSQNGSSLSVGEYVHYNLSSGGNFHVLTPILVKHRNF